MKQYVKLFEEFANEAEKKEMNKGPLDNAAINKALDKKAKEFAKIVKIGRTHLQDATPLTLGQEISGWVEQLDLAERAIANGLAPLHELAIGATAVSHRMGWRRDHNRGVSAVTGAMLVAVGVLMITNTFARLSGVFARLQSLRLGISRKIQAHPT